MRSISDTFTLAFKTLAERNWECIYVLVDVHGVMMAPNYKAISHEMYPQCVLPLNKLTNDKRVKLILWTCSNKDHIEEYLKIFERLGIEFDYVNANPEVAFKDSIGDYEVKLYANVIMDDKAGFDPMVDWDELDTYLESIQPENSPKDDYDKAREVLLIQ